MIELVGLGRGVPRKHEAEIGQGIAPPASERPLGGADQRRELAALRRDISDAAGAPLILRVNTTMRHVPSPAADLADIASRAGDAGPRHPHQARAAARARRRGVRGAYRALLRRARRRLARRCSTRRRASSSTRSSASCTVGRTAKDAAIADDIYRHTIDIIARADALGG